MKKDVTKFVTKCLTCQQVKIEQQKPARTLQPLPILSRPEFGNPENEGIRQANPILLLINFKEKGFI